MAPSSPAVEPPMPLLAPLLRQWQPLAHERRHGQLFGFGVVDDDAISTMKPWL
jgi:hypothetical protein